jgi:hypothetical protein
MVTRVPDFTLCQVARAVEVPVLGRLLCAHSDGVLPI